ncbi:metalloprotease [Planctomycetales bacterium]|nr:metalloprotease [Planctomycetales bacterium]
MLSLLSSAGEILLIVAAFSVLIFVHELGHFLAARLVGVRAEKFFIGFDIFGLGVKKKIGACVYGIGLLPLGGYVKLSGQSDDPSEQKNTENPEPWDYRAKPLWARAFIIAAGVLMNLLFGFFALVYMYLHGMATVPAYVGAVQENSSAYYAGLRSGDKILAIDGETLANFNKLREHIAINGGKNGDKVFHLQIERAGEIFNCNVTGQPNAALAGLVTLGIEPAHSTTVGGLAENIDQLQVGDEIVEIAGQKIPQPALDGYLLAAAVKPNAGKTLSAVVRRAATGKEETVDLPVAGVGDYDFGYSVSVGIAEISANYPAQRAGLQAGDRVLGYRVGDEEHSLLSVAQLMKAIRARAYQPAPLTVERGGEELSLTAPVLYSGGNDEVPPQQDSFLGVLIQPENDGARVVKILAGVVTPLQVGDVVTRVAGEKFTDLGAAAADASCREITLRVAGRGDITMRPQINRLNGVPLIGIMMEPLPMVYKVASASPAEKFLTPGDYVIETLLLPNGQTTVYWSNAARQAQKPVTFTTPPTALAALRDGKLPEVQGVLPGVGWLTTQFRQREALGGALAAAAGDTVDMSLTVYKLLKRLLTNEISAKAMSGPVGIVNFMTATLKAADPFMELLKLLALISINLAVFNILPFPVLDGGHLLFIFVEWLKGSPPSERLRSATQYLGIACLVALFMYVTFNDVNRIVKDFRDGAMLEYKGK